MTARSFWKVFFVSGCSGSLVFDFVDEALDGNAVMVQADAEDGHRGSLRHGPDISPDAALGHLRARDYLPMATPSISAGKSRSAHGDHQPNEHRAMFRQSGDIIDHSKSLNS